MKTMPKQRHLAQPLRTVQARRPRRPIITCEDRRRLGTLASANGESRPEPQAIAALDARLDEAVYVERDELPANVVTMNSTVELVDLRTHEWLLRTLVYPDEAEFIDDSLSVLEPLGMALLGCSVGNVIQCQTGRGTRRLRIERILQQQ
jgi:regulator of nucleoside diphosphate kinase